MQYSGSNQVIKSFQNYCAVSNSGSFASELDPLKSRQQQSHIK